MFHEDAFGFASRPLADVGPSGQFVQVFDEVSGLNLRLELYRQFKRTIFSLDALWGATLLDEALAARICSII